MHKLVFYPLCKEGAQPPNAESFAIWLENDRCLLIDYANMRDPNDRFDLRCDLPTLLKADLKAASRWDYDVVAFTHLDDDHIRGAGDFFWFEAFTTRQGPDRPKIKELWVPAAAIVETGVDGDAGVIRQEARHRLKKKSGIRVFSAPGTLTDWCKAEGLDINELRSLGLVIDAGKIVPGFSLQSDGVEFFIHSPFASRTEDGQRMERNRDALAFQATFQVQEQITQLLVTSDICHEDLDEIVRMTKLHKREERLRWDIIDIPHHCSYLGIGPDKGKDVTQPTANVKWLYEQGQPKGTIVSSSCTIPSGDTVQPPHRQAANFYKGVAANINGEFIALMDWPNPNSPAPLVIEITDRGSQAVRRIASVTAGGALTGSAPRVG